MIESVTGAATIACGLNLTQEYLATIGILKHKQEALAEKLQEMTEKQQKIEAKLVGTMISTKDIESVQKKIGYEFKCKTWLIEALTHKSAIDQGL